MAIRRCPYCKAIIDEQDKYCNNCGTQLLFPEDEYVEEEIPGDKIIEEEEEDAQEEELLEEEPEETDVGEEEDEEEKEGTTGELEEPEEEEEAEEEEGQEGEEEQGYFSEEKESEEDLEEEQEREEEPKEEYPTAGEPTFEDIARAGEREEEEPEKEKEADFEKLKDSTAEVAEESGEEEVLEKAIALPKQEDIGKYEASIEKDELIFKTKGPDKPNDTVDEGKDNLEEILGSFQGKKKEAEKPASDTKEELPPWASRMRDGVTPSDLEEEAEQEEEEQEEEEEEREEEEEEREEEEEIEEEREEETEDTAGEIEEEKPATGRGWTTDSGIGIPEKITQEGLPFKDSAALGEGEEREMTAEEEAEEATAVEQETRRRLGVPIRLKAKLIDLIFVTALWLISLWFTSRVIGVSFFRLIAGSLGPVLAFYLILLLLYFFLFLYFLGETLGDHYFSPEE